MNQIKAHAYEHSLSAGKSHNFPLALPEHLAEQAEEMLKSSYNLEFLGISREIRERELEGRLIHRLRRFPQIQNPEKNLRSSASSAVNPSEVPDHLEAKVKFSCFGVADVQERNRIPERAHLGDYEEIKARFANKADSAQD